VLRPLVLPLITGAALAGALACAPIQFGAADVAVRDGGDLAPVVDRDAGGMGSRDAGANPGVAQTEGFRAACGVISACSPDDARACTGAAPTDGGYAPDGGEADGGSADAAPTDLACRMTAARSSTACAPAGRVGPHGACTTDEECSGGYACAAGACERLCCDLGARCASDGACMLLPHSGQAPRFVPVCAPRRPCAFTGPTACGPESQCGFAADDGAPVCVATGPGREGSSCAIAPCASGFVCIGATNLERCAKTCDPSEPAGCPSGQRCRAHPALFATSAIGYCSPSE